MKSTASACIRDPRPRGGGGGGLRSSGRSAMADPAIRRELEQAFSAFHPRVRPCSQLRSQLHSQPTAQHPRMILRIFS